MSRPQRPGTRCGLLDELRGLALLSMILYHGAWDLVYIFGVSWDWYRSEFAYLWQQSICWTFILLSGFCQPLGRHQYRRGLTVWIAGAVVTIVTMVAMPDNLVMFGVLTCLGTCMLLTKFLEPVLRRCKPLHGVLLCAVLFVLTRNVPQGYLGFEDWKLCALPEWLYRNHLTAYFGFPHDAFWSTDYFAVFPWIFLFLTGYYLSRLFHVKKLMYLLKRGGRSPFAWIGRHSLILYMAHQPVCYGVLYVMMNYVVK